MSRSVALERKIHLIIKRPPSGGLMMFYVADSSGLSSFAIGFVPEN